MKKSLLQKVIYSWLYTKREKSKISTNQDQSFKKKFLLFKRKGRVDISPAMRLTQITGIEFSANNLNYILCHGQTPIIPIQ